MAGNRFFAGATRCEVMRRGFEDPKLVSVARFASSVANVDSALWLAGFANGTKVAKCEQSEDDKEKKGEAIHAGVTPRVGNLTSTLLVRDEREESIRRSG